jgi:hypothetical protein
VLINSLTRELYQTSPDCPLIGQKEVFAMASRTIPNKIESDLQFEWLLCLASTLQASERPQLAAANQLRLPTQFRRTGNRRFFEREWKKALSFARISSNPSCLL